MRGVKVYYFLIKYIEHIIFSRNNYIDIELPNLIFTNSSSSSSSSFCFFFFFINALGTTFPLSGFLSFVSFFFSPFFIYTQPSIESRRISHSENPFPFRFSRHAFLSMILPRSSSLSFHFFPPFLLTSGPVFHTDTCSTYIHTRARTHTYIHTHIHTYIHTYTETQTIDANHSHADTFILF